MRHQARQSGLNREDDMVRVDSLGAEELAQYALLVEYAWDMCDEDLNPDGKGTDPRIAMDGYSVVAYLTASDDIICSGPGGIRQQQIRPSGNADRKRYGYIASRSDNPKQYVVVIRGTDGAEEWIDDFVFVANPRQGFAGKVETGFWDIFDTMDVRLAGKDSGPYPAAAQYIQSLLDDKDKEVLIIGHSLGSAIATYLLYAVNRVDGQTDVPWRDRVAGLFFASPKTGDHDFVTSFALRVPNYLVVNYEHDVVPRVPPFDITCFDLYRALPNCKVITDETVTVPVNQDKACCHHLISYVAMLSPTVFSAAMASSHCTEDDLHCAKCVDLKDLATVVTQPASAPVCVEVAGA
jgi:hypothetical protein